MQFSPFFPLVALILSLPVAACAASPGVPVLSQEISVTLAPERHELCGEATTNFGPGVSRAAFRLAGSATIAAVKAAGHPVPYTFTGGVLVLDLPKGSAGSPVTVSYCARFQDRIDQTPGASEDPSYGVQGTITPQGTFLGDAAHWYPVPAQVPARRSLAVTAPAGTEAVSFGKRMLRETRDGVTRSRWEEANPVGALSLCAGPYRVEERRVDGIELHSYLYPENAALAGRYLDAAARYLTLYQGLFGAYPFEKFAVVENFFQTGYGFPSFTLLGGAVLRLPFIIDTSFPHEIAHSWWGNAIGIAPGTGNWCEGLVTYLADYLLKERRSPAEARDYRAQLLVDFASLVPEVSDFPLTAFQSRSDPASRAIGYGKAAFVFHMVRSRIGDEAFFAALREVCCQHLYGHASWQDFQRAFSKASGQELGPFMDQWLVRKGGPRLKLVEVAKHKTPGGWSVTGSVKQEGTPYQVTLPLRLQAGSQAVPGEVALLGGLTPFTLTSAAEPTRLLLDPDAQVFRLLALDEIPATVNSVKGSTRLVGVLTEGCAAGAEGFRDLLASLSQSAAPVVREGELAAAQLADKDLIFCGVPGKEFMKLPEEVRAGSDAFSIEGSPFAGPDALLFLVQRRPGSSGRVAALYLPLSGTAARQYYPKITHYGKYAELVFAQGANRRKGMLSGGDGAASVLFGPAR